MDTDITDGEKAWRQLHKNAARNFELVLEALPHKTAAVRPPTSHLENYQIRRTRHAWHSWKCRDELISDDLLLTPSHGRAKAWQTSRIYIQQLCEDTGCSPEDLPEAMNDRKEWRERVKDIRAGGSRWCWWWCIGWSTGSSWSCTWCFQ